MTVIIVCACVLCSVNVLANASSGFLAQFEEGALINSEMCSPKEESAICGEQEIRGHENLGIGSTAPRFALPSTSGSLVEYRPKASGPSVVLFWSIFCQTCQEEMDALSAFARVCADRGIQFLGVNVDGRRYDKVVRRYAEEKSIPFEILYDSLHDRTPATAQAYGVPGTPSIVMMDKQGRICWKSAGKVDFWKLDQHLRAMQGEG